jgi:hypothetical protein
MSAEPTVTKAARRAQADIQTAVEQARLAYEFVMPNSYTFSCLSACMAAERALAVLSDALSEEERGQEARPRAALRGAEQGR